MQPPYKKVQKSSIKAIASANYSIEIMSIVAWMNKLSAFEAEMLLETSSESTGVNLEAAQTTGVIVQGGRPMDSEMTHTVMGPDGQSLLDWMDWASCSVARLNLESGHPRWQPRILNHRGLTPPAVTATGRLIKECLAEERWEELKVMASKSSNFQVILNCAFANEFSLCCCRSSYLCTT